MKRSLRFFYNLNLKWKLLLSYALVVLIPLVMWGVYSYRQTNSALLEKAKTSFGSIFTNAASNFNSKIQRIENAFSAAAGDASVSQIINSDYTSDYQEYYDITNKFDPVFDTLNMLNPEIKGIDIFTNGTIKNSRQNFHDLEASLGEKEWLSAVSGVDTVWSLQEGSLYVSRQVFDINRLSRSSIILLELDYTAIMEGNFPGELQNYGVLVQDAGGREIFRLDQLQWDFGQGSMNASELERTAESQGKILCRKETLHNGWSLCVYMDLNAALMSPQAAFQPVLLQLTLSALLLAGMIFLFSHTMVRRVKRLNTYLTRVVKTGFQEEIASPDRDEIGSITNHVGRMVRETRELLEEVSRSHTQQREAEIKALQAQINPHFLYNTLSAINWQAIKSGNAGISKIATSLSAFYRSMLNQGRSVTTIGQELETTRAYLEIQQMTHEHSFDVAYSIDGDVLEYSMPGIILQPIVENAIEHGIDMKRDGGRGEIRIEARMEGSDIVFEVYDNGPGIREELLREVFSDSRRGYGVKNVNERLKLFFDDRYGLSFRRAGERGTRAVIRIPQYIDFSC